MYLFNMFIKNFRSKYPHLQSYLISPPSSLSASNSYITSPYLPGRVLHPAKGFETKLYPPLRSYERNYMTQSTLNHHHTPIQPKYLSS